MADDEQARQEPTQQDFDRALADFVRSLEFLVGSSKARPEWTRELGQPTRLAMLTELFMVAVASRLHLAESDERVEWRDVTFSPDFLEKLLDERNAYTGRLQALTGCVANWPIPAPPWWNEIGLTDQDAESE